MVDDMEREWWKWRGSGGKYGGESGGKYGGRVVDNVAGD